MHSPDIMGGRVTITLPDTNVTKSPITAHIAENRAAVAGVYTDAALSTAYVSGAVQGGTLYFKLSVERTFNMGARVSAWDTADEAAPNLTAMQVVKSTSQGGITSVEVVLLEDDAAPYLDGADYLFFVDTRLRGSLLHAWVHSDSGTVTTLALYMKLATAKYSPDMLGAEAVETSGVAGSMSPSSPVFLTGEELFIDSTCDNGTILELIIDPWVMGHRL